MLERISIVVAIIIIIVLLPWIVGKIHNKIVWGNWNEVGTATTWLLGLALSVVAIGVIMLFILAINAAYIYIKNG